MIAAENATAVVVAQSRRSGPVGAHVIPIIRTTHPTDPTFDLGDGYTTRLSGLRARLAQSCQTYKHGVAYRFLDANSDIAAETALAITAAVELDAALRKAFP